MKSPSSALGLFVIFVLLLMMGLALGRDYLGWPIPRLTDLW